MVKMIVKIGMILLVILAHTNLHIYSQQLPKGYFELSNFGAHSDSFSTMEGNRFFKTEPSGVHVRKYFEGSYEIVGDTLKLFYDSIPDPGNVKITSIAPLSANSVETFNLAVNFELHYKSFKKDAQITEDYLNQCNYSGMLIRQRFIIIIKYINVLRHTVDNFERVKAHGFAY